MDKTALEAALAALDTWIQVFAVLVAIGIVGEVGFGVRHWILNRRLQALQNYEDLKRQAEIARLNKEAGDARKSAGDAIERAAKAEERAAEANKKAEEERLARLKIEERLAPRRINAEQISRLVKDLKSLSGKKVILLVVSGNPETSVFGNSLRDALKTSGLIVELRPGMILGTVNPGISLTIGKNRFADANILANALIDAGLAEKPIPADKIPDDAIDRADELQIVLGPKH